MANPWGFPGDHGAVQQKKLLQERERTANTSDSALTQQSYGIQTEHVVFACTYSREARAKMFQQKQGFGIIQQGKDAKTLVGVRSKAGQHRETPGFHGVFAPSSLVFAALRTLRHKHNIPIVVAFLCFD